MNPTIAGIQALFEFVSNVGRWVGHHLSQTAKVDFKGKGEIKIVVDLGPQLESVIRDLLLTENSREDPTAFWAHATRELIRGNEPKFRTLQELGVGDLTLGIEAMAQPSAVVPKDIERVMVGYVERYVLADGTSEAGGWELPASPLSEALETVSRNVSGSDAGSYMERLGAPPVRLSKRWGQRQQKI